VCSKSEPVPGTRPQFCPPWRKRSTRFETVEQLAQSASATLNRLGYHNVVVRHGDGYGGWPDQAPFDRIVLTAAPPELPTALIDQLKLGGKLLAPVGDQSAVQELTLVEKTADGKITRRAKCCQCGSCR
jgi:protein-L-isoaspartate(D-aspartate) O-methyltransferase